MYQLKSADVSHPGNVRKRNEDSVLSRPAVGLWVVADGMGGHMAGDIASQKIVSAMGELSSTSLKDDGINVLEKCLEAVHLRIKAYGSNELAGNTIGSTVAVLFIENMYAHCFWVGDSRIYRFRDNSLEALTRDHSQAFELLDQGLLSAEEVDTHPSSHVLTKAVGSGEFKLDYRNYTLREGDQFLLCSDGLYGELSKEKMEEILQSGTIEENVRALLQHTMRQGARDNVSIILIDTAQ